jgi:hypothetical protein
VLDANLVIFGAVTKSFQRGGHDLLALQPLQVYDLVATNFRQLLVGRLLCLNSERYGDYKSRSGRLPVEREEIVIVDASPDRTGAKILQTVFQHHLWPVVR